MWGLIILAMLLDRVRGGFPEGKRPKWVKFLAKSVIGPCLTIQVTTDPLTIGLSVIVGHWAWLLSNSWRGNFVAWQDNRKEWDSEFLQASLGWGAWAGFPFLGLAHFSPSLQYYFVAFIIGTPLAMLLSLYLPKMPKFLEMRNAWPISEFIELGVIYLIFNQLVKLHG